MNYEKKYFGNPQNGGGDFDSAPFAVGPNNWVNAENIRTLTTDAGEVNTVESLGANVLFKNPFLPGVPPNQPQPVQYYLGGAIDTVNNRIVYAVWDSLTEHVFFCYDLTKRKIYIVLESAQVTGGFNLDKDHFINSARIINGNFYYTDALNEPRRFDIDAGIKMNDPTYVTNKLPYITPLSQSVVAWIRRQPGLPPTFNKITQTSPTVPSNQVANNAFLFCYRYIYRGFEISALSGFSTLCNYNDILYLFNRVDISIPIQESIDQDVIQVDLVAQYLETGVSFIINSWKTKIPADAAAIAAHNAGMAALTYKFYNNQTGIALDSAYSVKIFDSVPIISKTIEMAKNRSFMGNYLIGYNTPITTSLSLSIATNQFTPPGGTPGAIVGEWFLLRYGDGFGHNGSAYVLKTTMPVDPSVPISAFGYYYTWSGTVPPYPASVNAADLTFRGGNPGQVAMSLNAPNPGIPLSNVDQGTQSTVISATPPISDVQGIAFKSDAAYRVSISFKDNYGRECGILTTDNLYVITPDTGLNNYSYVIAINWLLSNANALNEIPDWAYYYSINITKCLRTRFFVQCIGPVIYAAKDASNNYTFTTTAYASNLAGIAVDVSLLQADGMGYSFTPGDILKLCVPIFGIKTIFSLSIIDQAAQYVICQLRNVGALSAVIGEYEIYTPYKPQSNEPYFEVAQIFPILNPTTNTRIYSTLNGTLGGDVYIFARSIGSNGFVDEAMNINDKFYLNWFTNSGRPNFVDDIGQVNKVSSTDFSNTYIPGSQVNGLSTYDALDTKDIYPECGPIQKLQLTSKVEGEIGTIMLCICTKETASLYLGETQVMSTTGDAFIAQASGVIGTINVLKGSFGTINPESVIEFRGNVYWVNIMNGDVVQYSGNGLFPISNYKITRFWKLFCLQYDSMTTEEIEALGSRPFIFSTVDPHNWELLISVPKTLAVPPKGYLPDYPDMIYPFDIWDGQAKTIVYKLNAQPNHWSGAYPFSPEGMIAIQNRVFSFQKGEVYEHNSQVFPCSYYGVPVKARIMFVSNQVPNRPKVFNNVSIEGNSKPSLIYMRTEPELLEFDQYDLEEQASDLLDIDFEVKEGILYAAIFRNKLQPTAEGFNTDGLLTGNKMRAVTLLVLAEFNTQRGPLELRFINFGYQVSAGHTT